MPMDEGIDGSAGRAGAGRRTNFRMGMVVALIAFTGFARTFYLRPAFFQQPLSRLVFIHGIVMTAWVALFTAQSWLVAKRRVDVHRKLGIAGALLAALVLILGVRTAIVATRLGHAPGPPIPFLAVPLFDMAIFGTLIGLGLYHRRRPDLHKRLMLLGTLSILSAPFGRLVPLVFHRRMPPMALVLMSLTTLACVAYDTVKHRRLHPVFGWGFLLIAASCPLRLWVGTTETWHAFAIWLTT